MGYDPTKQIHYCYYTIGFNSVVNNVLANGAYDVAINPSLTVRQYVASALTSGPFLQNTALGDQMTITNQTFVAGAAGIVHKKFTASELLANSCSFMAIKEDKVISIVGNGF